MSFMQELEKSLSDASLLLERTRNNRGVSSKQQSTASLADIKEASYLSDNNILNESREVHKVDETTVQIVIEDTTPVHEDKQPALKTANFTPQASFSVDSENAVKPATKVPDGDEVLFQKTSVKIDQLEQLQTRISNQTTNLFKKQQQEIHQTAKLQIENMNELLVFQSQKQMEYFDMIESVFKERAANQKHMVSENTTNAYKAPTRSQPTVTSGSRETNIINNDLAALKDDIKQVKKAVDDISAIILNQNIPDKITFSLPDTVPRKKIEQFNYAKIRQELKKIDMESKHFERETNRLDTVLANVNSNMAPPNDTDDKQARVPPPKVTTPSKKPIKSKSGGLQSEPGGTQMYSMSNSVKDPAGRNLFKFLNQFQKRLEHPFKFQNRNRGRPNRLQTYLHHLQDRRLLFPSLSRRTLLTAIPARGSFTMSV
jgi:hypothetical protein